MRRTDSESGGGREWPGGCLQGARCISGFSHDLITPECLQGARSLSDPLVFRSPAQMGRDTAASAPCAGRFSAGLAVSEAIERGSWLSETRSARLRTIGKDSVVERAHEYRKR